MPFKDEVPTSITTDFLLIYSLFIYFALPIATIKISAFLQISFKFDVFEWHIVTVAFLLSNNWATGFPTILLRPITTTFLPCKSTLYLSSNVITELGVQGKKTSSPQ